jgi:hypothetical protein
MGATGDSFGAYTGGQRIEPGCGGPAAIKRSPIRITNLRRAFTRAPLLTVEMTFMSVELRKISRIGLIVIDLYRSRNYAEAWVA